jgi:hypothetical protein
MNAPLHRAVGGTAGWARIAAVAVAIVAVSGSVVSRSSSAFSDTTDNGQNNLSTGSVVLTDNDNGTALYNVSGLIANQSETRCIEVQYTGTSALVGPVRLYGGYADGPDGNTSADSALAAYLDLRVELGNAGITCASTFAGTTVYDSTVPAASAGTLAAFTGAYTDWLSGLSTTWTPAAASDEIRAFRIRVTVKDDNNAQAKTAEPTFTWEARGN